MIYILRNPVLISEMDKSFSPAPFHVKARGWKKQTPNQHLPPAGIHVSAQPQSGDGMEN